jgi:hypothetical protein
MADRGEKYGTILGIFMTPKKYNIERKTPIRTPVSYHKLYPPSSNGLWRLASDD